MTNLSDYRFTDEQVQWKPISVSGNRALGGAYVDVRHIQAALEDLAPDWHSDITLLPSGNKWAAVCKLEVGDVVRSDTGEGASPMDASNQAFRRAACAHGLGRYLWFSPQVWADYDNARKRFTQGGLDALRRALGPQVAQHTAARETPIQKGSTQPRIDADDHGDGQDNPFTDTTAGATATQPDIAKLRRQFHAIGTKLYDDRWSDVRHKNIARLTDGRTEHTNDLDATELQTLIGGMQQLQRNPKVTQPAQRNGVPA